ncbi:DUF4402 domain-containing protein [Sphingomonas lacunae]|uniref:DUF4402 domain-containing protein n=1 Tax=Sphingomonas lacunae TaxID=2698828 RepID=A0A6M4AVY7_9SPHN|nr:DUF4402 domain-containing protein [Sphingomonas lacunae]QJQ32179.1 DUF4402 domain-containing protein [Sphingomonas lacunae]
MLTGFTGLLLASTAFVEDQATATATARAEVLQQISAVNTADLDFGTISRGSIAGQVTIAADGSGRSVSGGVSGAGGNHHPAQFLASGTPNRTYSISHDGGATLTNGSGGTLTISSLMIDGPTTRQFDANGESVIGVGGVLAVAGNQAEGSYSGSFSLTVDYQ